MSATRFRQFCHLTLAFTLAVIVWGAYVRASGSGAGCGNHWPTCNGQVIPRPQSMATVIEVTHRAMSGLLLFLVLGQLVWAFRAFGRGHGVRRAAVASMLFILTEALIGGGLVLFEMVAGNKSVARGAWVAAHLLNTFALVASIVLVGWRAKDRPPSDAAGPIVTTGLRVGLAGTLIVGVSGAIAALGDTLFPARSFAQGWRADLSPAAHAFVRLRVWHPVLAVLVGVTLLSVTGAMVVRDRPPQARGAATLLAALVLAQLCAGLLNLVLLAPIAMQLVHLLLADLVWIALVRVAATVRLGARG